MELVGSALQFVSGSVGEGEFTEEEDRKKLAPVLRQAVLRKLMFCLKAQDLPAYRWHLNLQSVYFRGLSVEPVRDIVPGYETSKDTDPVAEFFHQNGFVSVRDIDKAGWSPLHYAAMKGDAALVDGLLRRQADPNKRTAREQPKLLGCSVVPLFPFLGGGLGSLINPFKQQGAPFLSLGYWAAEVGMSTLDVGSRPHHALQAKRRSTRAHCCPGEA